MCFLECFWRYFTSAKNIELFANAVVNKRVYLEQSAGTMKADSCQFYLLVWIKNEDNLTLNTSWFMITEGGRLSRLHSALNPCWVAAPAVVKPFWGNECSAPTNSKCHEFTASGPKAYLVFISSGTLNPSLSHFRFLLPPYSFHMRSLYLSRSAKHSLTRTMTGTSWMLERLGTEGKIPRASLPPLKLDSNIRFPRSYSSYFDFIINSRLLSSLNKDLKQMFWFILLNL